MLRKRNFFIVLVSFSLMFIFSVPVQARSLIKDILAKGSKWSLNVDGAIGIMELLGGKGSRTGDGGWEMTMEIRWQGNSGTLKAKADGKNREQWVMLNVQRENGLKITCEGYIATESHRFMAGITRHPAKPQDIHGSWCAEKVKIAREVLDYGRRPVERKPVSKTEMKPQTRTPERPAATTGKCSISGKIYGPGVESARIFFVILYGPDNLSLYRETKRFDREGGYTFPGLPAGKYKLVVDSRSDTAIGPHPASRIVHCTGDGAVNNINFELK